MPPKKWDDESEDETSSDESVEVQPVAVRKKFGDEEDSDDVADNWEEEEDSEVEREKAAKAAAAKAKADAEAAANKKTKSQRIEERREANRLKKATDDIDSSDDEDEDEAEKRARLRKSEQDADLKHAQDLLAAADIHPRSKVAAGGKSIVIEDKSAPGEAIDLSKYPLFRPATKTQFEALSDVLVPLLAASSSKPHYSIWVSNFIKQICTDLPSTEIKKAASTLTTLSNEKLKEEKDKDKTKKKTTAAKTKTSLSAGRDLGRGVADTTSYDDGLAEEDFM